MTATHPRHAAPATAPLTLSNISIAFPSATGNTVAIVNDMNITLLAGDMFCLIGRSGSGKTSILRAAAGITRPTAGTITWWGIDVGALTEQEIRDTRRTRIGYLDQVSAMIPDLTSLENVLIPALPDGRKAAQQRRPAAEELLNRLGLSSRAHHLATQLSGGERQRVALARAMINQPDLLIADEPTASLDRATADDIITVLAEYAKGHAVLAASHDPHVAAAAATTHTLED